MRLSLAHLGNAHPDSSAIHAQLGVALAANGAHEAGVRELGQAIDAFDAAAKPDPARHALALESLVRVQLDAGEAQAALGSLENLAALLPSVPDNDGYWVARIPALRARGLQRLGRNEDASRAYAEAASLLDALPRSDALLHAEVALGRAEMAALAAEPASPALRSLALARFDALRGAPSALLARAALLRAQETR